MNHDRNLLSLPGFDIERVMLSTIMLPMREACMKLHKAVQVNAIDDYGDEIVCDVLYGFSVCCL